LAGYNNLTGSRNVFLGYKAGYNETGSDKLYIENSDIATPLIYGDFATNYLRINGNLQASGTYFRIETNPGATIPPVAYSYQGLTGSTGKDFAFTVYDAFWVTSNAWVDGTFYNAKGIVSYSNDTTGLAGSFGGNVDITGLVTKSSSETKIDHPLDPENKFLNHAEISSDQMTNIYHGNAVLDSNGKALVELAEWVEEVNRDFRYQLTAIGAPGPNLYISKKIKNNTFEISGGTEGMEVSWQLTGIRNDNYARKNTMKIEELKKQDEKGYYLHPDVYGLPEDKGIEYNIQKKQNRSEKE
jgi:hypothetical protein